MKKTLLLVTLLLSFSTYTQASDKNNQNINVKEEVNNQTETLSEEYYKNGSEASHQCDTRKSGTYTEYHSNGMLKSFSIVD